MFVLPPPPRYPTQMMYGGGYMGNQMMPLIETNNVLSRPKGPDCQFLAGEGLYVLKDEILLATPPPHPSEAPVLNPNPLATTPLPATAGTKLSLVSIVDHPRPKALEQLLANAKAEKAAAGVESASSEPQFVTLKEHVDGEGAGRSSAATDSTTGRLSFNTPSATSIGSDTALASPTTAAPAPAATTATESTGVYNPLLTANYNNIATIATGTFAGFASMGGSKTAGNKLRKPKNNVTKSNSSFISRAILHETLPKRLADRDPASLYYFGNINRGFQWLDFADEDKKAEYMTKMLFTKAHCLCHDTNPLSKTNTHIDVIMGFSTGEIIWYEPISQRYTRLNKNGIIRGTPVSEIRWIPGSENLFMAAYMDGSMVIFDKEKEDAAFVYNEEEANHQRLSNSDEARLQIQIERSIYSSQSKTNPFAFWKISNQRINSFAFAPDGQTLIAVVSEDGSLRIIDYLREELVSIFYAYYGGLTCVCWSPDGKYIVTGGQDDLLSIWSVAESTLVARCQGHHSWVTSVAFDPWRCDDRVYRFGSVGEDARLCLWDFNIGMLIRPRVATANSGSNIQTTSTAGPDSESKKQQPAGESSGEDTDGFVMVDEANASDARVHRVEPRATTAMLPPVCSKIVDKDPLSWLGFTETSIITSSKTGLIRTWSRPSDSASPAADDAQAAGTAAK
ncbi:catabolite repression protein crec [Ophiostoma piceae UAMH 11346]|uniref:Catabolite repression protein crec n=1 Tax=Ophiostoma piceae (strain UAMH 11346) TaxID=1262450 RepID=S3CA26_OPHP1|nr:catabolite repression protein crec [Ophiostoma piceae UAMH 11346]